MTNTADWSDDQLAALAGLPLDHPEVLAVRANPERWARLIALREFLYADEPPPGARTDQAVARIRAALRAAHDDPPRAQAPVAPVPPSAQQAAPAHTIPARIAGYWPAFAVAAALIAVGLMALPRVLDHRGTLRGTERAHLHAGAVVEGDSVRFAWPGVAGAELYELRLFREDLTPIGPVLPIEDSRVRLPVAALLGAGGSAGTVLWRVTAVRSGMPLLESDMERVRVP